MGADANVFAQFLKMPPSAMDYADRFAASDMAREQDAMNRLLMQEKKQALEEQNRLKQLYMQNPGITPDELRRSGFRNEAAQMEGAALERRKTETDIGYKEAQTSKEKVEAGAKAADAAYAKLGRHAQNIAGIRTPEDIMAYVDAGIRDGVPGFTPDMRQKAIENFQRLGSVEAWKQAATEASIPVLDRYKIAAEDARAALKASMPDYTVLDSSTGVVRVDKKTGLAQPVTYAPTGAPQQAAGGIPSGAPSGAPASKVKPVTPGNIDLNNRPVVKNADGSVSTVRSMSVNFDGKEVLIPTVSEDGRVMSDEEAIQQYRKTGRHLGMFNTPQEATEYAKSLHDAQANRYARPGASERYISPETQKARDTDRLTILRQEWQTATNPEDKAAIGREIVRAGDAVPTSANVAAPAPSAPMQVQPRQKDPGQPFKAVGADGKPGMFVMVGGKPVRVEGIGPDEGAPKPMTEGQSKALLFGSRMQEADKLIASLSAKGVDKPSLIKQGAESVPFIGGGLGALANPLASPDQQRVEQAQRDFINAALRRESGAVISDSEFDNARKQYFPQVGDSEAVKRQKAENRRLATRGVLAEVPEKERASLSSPSSANGGWTVTEVK
jgi:hypothetical protein